MEHLRPGRRSVATLAVLSYRGYLVRCHVAETEEKALRNAREFMWMQGELIGLQHPVWATPSGYLGNWARRGLAELRAGYRTDMGARASFEDHLQSLSIIAGTPGRWSKSCGSSWKRPNLRF